MYVLLQRNNFILKLLSSQSCCNEYDLLFLPKFLGKYIKLVYFGSDVEYPRTGEQHIYLKLYRTHKFLNFIRRRIIKAINSFPRRILYPQIYIFGVRTCIIVFPGAAKGCVTITQGEKAEIHFAPGNFEKSETERATSRITKYSRKILVDLCLVLFKWLSKYSRPSINQYYCRVVLGPEGPITRIRLLELALASLKLQPGFQSINQSIQVVQQGRPLWARPCTMAPPPLELSDVLCHICLGILIEPVTMPCKHRMCHVRAGNRNSEPGFQKNIQKNRTFNF